VAGVSFAVHVPNGQCKSIGSRFNTPGLHISGSAGRSSHSLGFEAEAVAADAGPPLGSSIDKMAAPSQNVQSLSRSIKHIFAQYCLIGFAE
jgi:hypothetical protein